MLNGVKMKMGSVVVNKSRRVGDGRESSGCIVSDALAALLGQRHGSKDLTLIRTKVSVIPNVFDVGEVRPVTEADSRLRAVWARARYWQPCWLSGVTANLFTAGKRKRPTCCRRMLTMSIVSSPMPKGHVVSASRLRKSSSSLLQLGIGGGRLAS